MHQTPPTADAPMLAEVVTVLDGLYPPDTAQSWDRVGLVAGDPDQPVRSVLYAVDPTLAVVAEAAELGADLLVTHHPLLLRGIHTVATTTAKGAGVTALVRSGTGLYVAHTNADVAEGGVNDALAAACGLGETEPLVMEEGQPLGRVGDLPAPTTLADFARTLAAALPTAPVGIRVAGEASAEVRRVAVLGGAGDGAFDAVRASGADVYVTADLRHHPALEAREEARGGRPFLVDAGHWASESLWLAEGARRLVDALAAAQPDRARLVTHLSAVRTDPWDFTVGTSGPSAAPEPATEGGPL